MKRSIISFCLCLGMLLSTMPVGAQTPATQKPTWDDLRQTPAGQNLRVKRKDGKKFSGFAVNISDTELLIERDGIIERFKQDEVKDVWKVAGPSPRKQRLFGSIGVGVGLMAGLMIAVGLGFKQCNGSCNDERVGIYAAVVGLPIGGALAGRALAGKTKRTLIYSAP